MKRTYRKHDGINFINERYGRLNILKLIGKNKKNKPLYLCKCDCGNEKEIAFEQLRNKSTQSCGCLQKEKIKEYNDEQRKKYIVDWDAEERKCCKCKIVKNKSQFGTGRGSWGRMCKQCSLEKAKNYRDSGKSRKNVVERKYGIKFEFFLRMLEEQDNKCKICSKILETGVKGLAIDHDHITNKVRGILCRDCNLGLGFFKDNIFSLLKATDYLKDNYSHKY